MTLAIFLAFVGFTLALSFYLGRKAKTSGGYFAAHGQVGWFVNGMAFAGDYLSAASFLGICGMIAFYGYDGFLYSIGFLAGWVVALLVIAEPIKKLGKFTFADALNSRFNSKAVTFAAALSALVVSTLYLIPQMVGAGALIKTLLGWPHYAGVITVGTAVIVIVATAGMVSTTWVQFIKGSLLIVFCAGLTVAILGRGIAPTPALREMARDGKGRLLSPTTPKGGAVLAVAPKAGAPPSVVASTEGWSKDSTGPLGPAAFVAGVSEATVVHWEKPAKPGEPWVGTPVKGEELLAPGGYPLFAGVRAKEMYKRVDFVSLMLALFAGTASLPHILIRYYTVKDAAAARKSTVVGIGAIGFFYCLTLFVGLGAMVSGNLDPTDTNMAAPLLAKSFGEVPFALISAIAFTTVLGTVSGLILAGSGAVAHDLIENVMGVRQSEHKKVMTAKFASVGIGIVAMGLGIVFKDLNAGFLVGWAFNVAASANLPALVMLLFWRRTTAAGITASVLVGLLTSLGWLFLTGPAFQYVYGLKASDAIVSFSQPAIVTLPLSLATLVAVSLMTKRNVAR